MKNVDTFDPITIQFSYTQFVFGKFLRAKGLGEKFRAVFYGPGFSEALPEHRLGRNEDIPKVDPNHKSFDPKIRRVSKNSKICILK